MASEKTTKIDVGYMGIANIGGEITRCTSFNVSPTQELLFYDHVQGLNDTMTGGTTKGEAIGRPVIQRTICRPARISIGGNISFPLTSGSAAGVELFKYASRGDVFDVEFTHTCGKITAFSGCRVNSFSFNITAGDVASVSADILATSIESKSGSSSNYTSLEKLITWDAVTVEVNNDIGKDLINSFSLDINNNAQYIYTAATDNPSGKLGPLEIRLGTQSVTGMIGVYNKKDVVFLDEGSGYNIITVTCRGSLGFIVKSVFLPSTIEGVTGAVISNVPFVGVDYPFEE